MKIAISTLVLLIVGMVVGATIVYVQFMTMFMR